MKYKFSPQIFLLGFIFCFLANTQNQAFAQKTKKTNGFFQIPLDSLRNVYLTPASAHSQGRSLALIPTELKSKAPYLLLYFHGLNHQEVNDKNLTIPRLEYDRFPEQIQKSGHGQDLIGLFPLADPHILFPPADPNFDFSIPDYLAESFAHLPLQLSYQKLPLILMAHSSGGTVVQKMLASDELLNIKAVIFLDGINGTEEVPGMKKELLSRIQKQIDWLTNHPVNKEQERYLKTLPFFSFYYSFYYKSYVKAHQQVEHFLEEFWKKQIEKLPLENQAFLQKLKQHYQFFPLDPKITHSNMMRSGVVEKALRTLDKTDNIN